MDQLLLAVGSIAVIGTALGGLIRTLVQLVKFLDEKFQFFSIPDGVYFWVVLVVAVVANAVVFVAPFFQQIDLGLLSVMLSNIDTTLAEVLTFLMSPLMAWVFRQLDGVSKSG